MADASSAAAAPKGCDGLARPRDFSARHGEGLRLGVSLGGGGVFFVAWQASYLRELAGRGVDLRGADRIVGTSAGSLVATLLESGRLARFQRQLMMLAKVPKLLGALAPAGDLNPSQERALDQFREAVDAKPETIRDIGHAALAAQTRGPAVMSRNVGLVLMSRRWPSDTLQIVCVDAFTGERCVVTRSAHVSITRAVAASSAVPGLFAPQPIGDRLCMDGGVSGSGTHLDLLAGAARVVVLGLSDGSDIVEGLMTTSPGATERELEALGDSGTALFHRVPEVVDAMTLMDPRTVTDAIAMGRRQAAADHDELRAFLA